MHPDTGQRTALAQVFGCVRAVFNDAGAQGRAQALDVREGSAGRTRGREQPP
ncbi:helix-turn-helix domain-containing protein [Streptomyces sp. NPDC102360]|uniref:helix-turn-helix domain-containing protein n=1 Tax=Streptomyces sp. NPDC102360 TaxID=3366160 RepID=UPI00382174F7